MKDDIRTFRPLGFDLRCSLSDWQASGWNAYRRSSYLIKPDVCVPASVDRAVWAPFARPEMILPLNLWHSVGQMRADLKGMNTLPLPEAVAILVELLECPRQEEQFTGIIPLDWKVYTPAVLKTRILGLDLADEALVSGLSNCQLSVEELLEVRARWSSAINHVGLVSDVSAALELKLDLDRLVPEHAPFFVFRVTEILEVESPQRYR